MLGRAGATTTTTTGAERPFAPFSLEQPGQVVISWSRSGSSGRLPGQLAARRVGLVRDDCFLLLLLILLLPPALGLGQARRLSG